MKKNLYNKKNKQDLIKEIDKENFNRSTYSFYRYTKLKNMTLTHASFKEKKERLLKKIIKR